MTDRLTGRPTNQPTDGHKASQGTFTFNSIQVFNQRTGLLKGQFNK